MDKSSYLALRAELIAMGYMDKADSHGWKVVAFELAQFALSLFALTQVSTLSWVYWALQIWLAMGIFRAFVLVHECGHGALFATRRYNRIFGRLFGIICLIPADNWRIAHFQHHIWVGVVDKDPTSAGVLEVQKYSKGLRRISLVLWKLRIPLAAIGGVFRGFWMFPMAQAREGNAKNVNIGWMSNIITITPWIACLVLWGWGPLLTTIGPALVIYYVWFECINLTHHGGLYTLISDTHPEPVPLYQQAQHCRSARLPEWLSLVTCYHFNLHTEHHLFPTIPWHRAPALRQRLHQANVAGATEVDFLAFMKTIRAGDPFDIFIDSAPSHTCAGDFRH